ncbi:TetR/AcrR family transcriptional regulator [uncultured Methanobacterium sp.]|uniref:TetR/AcrR family transcriptional regulator n=1 Tax=uncultured Methanobacterium sp. TaxID=176306 RepID=UPI002AA7C24D|nr:TetR/AcrR family transcriptional regulator [uncultured Methanobacterium sp.]
MKEKEQKILDTSLKLFVEKGFHGTSTAEIAKTAGVATGTLFHYFKTKEELIDRLYIYTKESILEEVQGDYDENNPFKDNVKLLWLKFVCLGIKDPYKFNFIMTFHCSPYITAFTKGRIEEKFVELLEIYKKGFEEGKIKEIYDELLMDYFWGNILNTIMHFEKNPEKMNKENVDLSFELFWDGISR